MRSTALMPSWLMRATDVASAEKLELAEGRLAHGENEAMADAVPVPRWLVEHATLSDDAKVVYAVAAARLAQPGQEGWPRSLDEIAVASGLSGAHVLTALRELKDAALIVDPASERD